MLAAIIYTVSICYESGGSTFRTWSLVGAPVGMYEGIAKAVAETDRTVTDPGKNWGVGFGLRDRECYSSDAEPVCLVAASSAGCDADVERLCSAVCADIFLVWLSKLLVLSFVAFHFTEG